MNVSLTPMLEAFVRQRVKSGLYNNASEVVREALRLLVTREDAALQFTGSPDKAAVRATLAALEPLLRDRGVTSLSLFGSVLAGEAGPDSDIDVLIDVAPDMPFSLIDLAAIKNLLADNLGREVDVVMRQGLDLAIRERVQSDAERVF